MTNDQSEPRWPAYRSGPPEHMRALGIVMVNYNLFERSLFGVLSHHLQTAGLSYKEAQYIYWTLDNDRRTRLVRFLFVEREQDQNVRDHVDYLVKYFNQCSESRNVLAHGFPENCLDNLGLAGWRFSSQQDTLDLLKSPKDDWSKVNNYRIPLQMLKTIADDMHRGHEYSFNLWLYLAGRDGSTGPLGGLLSSALPDKPPPPSSLPIHPPPEAPDNAPSLPEPSQA